MPEFNPKRGKDLKVALFKQLKADLELLDKAFDRALLAQWMGQDKGNFSKVMLGDMGLTKRFYRKFYERLGKVVDQKKKGVSSDEIMAEMQVNEKPRDNNTPLKERMKAAEDRLAQLEQKVNQQEAEIRELKAAKDGTEGPRGEG